MPYSIRPPMKHRLRPQRSVSLLQGIINTAMISKNSVIVVCTPFTSVCKSWLMSLIITFIFEPAKLQMNGELGVLALELDRGQIREGGVPAAGVVPALDELEDRGSRLG